MQQLAIAYGDVARIAYYRNSTFKAFAARTADQIGYVEFAVLMCLQNPNTVDCSAAEHLRHKVEAVNVLVKIGIVPMGDPVLVPRYGGANARVFDKQRLIEWGEVCAINGFRDFQQFRVTIDAQARIGKLQRAK